MQRIVDMVVMVSRFTARKAQYFEMQSHYSQYVGKLRFYQFHTYCAVTCYNNFNVEHVVINISVLTQNLSNENEWHKIDQS